MSTQPASGTASTDAQGTFTIANVPPGAYTVQATAATYATTGSNANITVTAGQTATAGIALAPLPYLDVVVGNTTDVVNGNVTSTRALFLSPGSDGISLREAITAVNNTAGAHVISFATELSGQLIALTTHPNDGSGLPAIRRDSVSIVGMFGTDGKPSVTLDISAIPAGGQHSTITVYASAFRLSRLRFVGVVGSENRAVNIRSGNVCCSSVPAPAHVHDIVIEDNVFDNSGIDGDSNGIHLGIDQLAAGGHISNVTITHNSFHHFAGNADGVGVQAGSSNALIENVTISENSFSTCTFPVEIVTPNGANNRIAGTRIVGNYFADGLAQAITVANGWEPGRDPSSNNVIDSTLIARNVIVRQAGPAISIAGGYGTNTGSAVLNTLILNNLIANNAVNSVISITGGHSGGVANRVQGVRLINNTIANANGAAINVRNNRDDTGNNIIADLFVSNAVFWGNIADVCCSDLTNSQIHFSLFSSLNPRGGGLLGTNGNFSSDPLFVDPANGDFHLRAGSPAIGAGASDGAPATDIECRPRAGKPDIGAFQSGGSAVCALPKPFW